jgi:hypothetical protein
LKVKSYAKDTTNKKFLLAMGRVQIEEFRDSGIKELATYLI